MMTKQEQLDVLNDQNTLAKKTLLDLSDRIKEAKNDEIKNYRVSELERFADQVVNKLIAKNGEAEQILQMWINFNDAMKNNPHLGERWDEIMAIMTLIN